MKKSLPCYVAVLLLAVCFCLISKVELLRMESERLGLQVQQQQDEIRRQARLAEMFDNGEVLLVMAKQTEKRKNSMEERAKWLQGKLSIPDNLIRINPSEALTDTNLTKFWPYFELKQKCEDLQRLETALLLRAYRETLEISSAAF